MASRTSNQAWPEGLDACTILQIVTAEIQTANVAYFQRKIQLSGFSVYPDGSLSQLIRIIGVLLYLTNSRKGLKGNHHTVLQ